MDTNIGKLALTIRFKEYLLNRDVASRRVILAACIEFMQNTSDEKKPQVLAWLQNLVAIMSATDTEERKQRIRFDACWDELHYELLNSSMFMYLISSIGI